MNACIFNYHCSKLAEKKPRALRRFLDIPAITVYVSFLIISLLLAIERGKKKKPANTNECTHIYKSILYLGFFSQIFLSYLLLQYVDQIRQYSCIISFCMLIIKNIKSCDHQNELFKTFCVLSLPNY